MPLALALLVLALHGLVLLRLGAGARAMGRLRDEPALAADERAPTVSIVLAARDEEAALERALRSMLAQDYPALQLIAVDDRSADRTGEIIDRVAAEDARVLALHVGELPEGWLGKNHALFLGAQAATGEWLLFTDGDVIMEPEAVSRAVAFVQRRQLDFLAVAPRVILPTAPLALLTTFFTLCLFTWLEPWKARRPGSRQHMGTGAFNLVRYATYEALGTHRRIALRPDDDMKLAKAAKLAGGRQDVVAGDGLLAVEWYADARAFAMGLRKNMLAGIDYRVSTFVIASAGVLLMYVWPFLALPLTTGAARAAYLASALLAMLAYAGVAGRDRPWLAPAVPVAAAATMAVLWAAIVRTLRRGGIEWRGTFYPLAQLKRNRV